MKKLVSSAFVILVLLNVMGYYGVFLGLQYKNALEMKQLFDDGSYDQELARTLKVPFHSPDSYGSEIYERVDGDFVRDGEMYRIIKQRLYRDTFHIIYIKDQKGTAINKSLSDYVKTFSDQSSPAQKSFVPFFIKEYFSKTISMQRLAPGWEQTARQETHLNVFIPSFASGIIHPPERA